MDSDSIYLIILAIQVLLTILASFFLFKKTKTPCFKAFIPIYNSAVAYKTVGMSALWIFSQIPSAIVSIPGLRIPVWLHALSFIINYGVDILFAINLARAFNKKIGFIILSFLFPHIMQIIASVSKKSVYNKHFNRYKYRKVGNKYVKKSEYKSEKEKLFKEYQEKTKKEILSEPDPPEKTGILKKITDFLVVRHKLVLAVIIIITLGCAFLSTKVNVNRDLTKYMPASSDTAKGLDIMYSEFESVLAMPLSVMVDNLSDEEKLAEKEYLEHLDGVASITYNDSESYNKDNHTLYELTISGKSDSENAASVFKTIKEHYAKQNKPLEVRGEVATTNTPSLPIWVIAIAVISALIILIIMAESYVEPILYLIAIGLAVVVNMGTNAFLPSVSQITNSITAVLQLALSMDYSIMLATEYHREKIKGKDKINAMKAALSRSFVSISASSVTTIVGMLVLILMSFTIGRDLGIVLAKGVLLCLLFIFTVLPALLLIFDNLVEKTKKRPFSPKLDFLGNISYKIRKFSIPLFLLIMGGAFFAQLQVGNLYTNTDSEAIDNIFGPYNQTVLIYNLKDEEKITEVCRNLERNNYTSRALCYGNTIDDPQKAETLVDKFAALGTKVNVDNELIRFAYYHNYDKDETHRLSPREFVSYLRNNGKDNAFLSKFINEDTIGKLDRLAEFTEPDNLYRWRNIYDLANILEIPADKLSDLMVLYGSYAPNSTKLTLEQLSNFIKSDVLTNPTYASAVSSSTRDNLDLLDIVIDISKNVSVEKYDYLVNNIHIDIDSILKKLDISEKTRNIIKAKLSKGRFVLNAAIKQTSLSIDDVAINLGIDRSSLALLYSLYNYKNGTGTYGMSLYQLISFLNNTVLNSSYANRLTTDQATKIHAIMNIINSAETPSSGAELYSLISPLSDNISQDQLELLVIFHGSEKAYPEYITMTPESFVNFLNENILADPRLKNVLNEEVSTKIVAAKNTIKKAKDQLVAKEYGRVVIRSTLPAEGEETFKYIDDIKTEIENHNLEEPAYLVGNSAMAVEMSKTFSTESMIITIVTAIVIYLVVAISFKSWFIPIILVAVIQTAVWITMTITGLTDGSIYFLSLIIVQSLLMGATIDYAIMYTEQYVAARKNGLKIKDSVVRGYNKSIQAILTSAGVLTIVTAIVGNFASSTAAKICKAISDGTFFSTILILLLLPALMAVCDKLVVGNIKKTN